MDAQSGFKFEDSDRIRHFEKIDGYIVNTGHERYLKEVGQKTVFADFEDEEKGVFYYGKNGVVISGDDPKFFLNMMSVNPEDELEIINFYNSYMPLLGKRLDNHSIESESDKEESIDEAKRAFIYFQNTFKLCAAISDNDESLALRLLYDIYDMCIRRPVPMNYYIVEENLKTYFESVREDEFTGIHIFRNLLLNYDPSSSESFIDFLNNFKQKYMDEAKEIFTISASHPARVKMIQRQIMDEGPLWSANHPAAARMMSNRFLSLELLPDASRSARAKMLRELDYGFSTIEELAENVNKALNNQSSIIIRMAKVIAEMIIELHIQSVRPRIEIIPRASKGRWEVDHPLSAVYFNFYLDLCAGSVYRKCNNNTCNEYFKIYGSDNRKQYCSHTCANTVSVRRNRSKIRLEKLHQKKEGEQNGNR